MIIPVSHEREYLLRWPIVTWGLIILCLAAHLLLSSPLDEMALYGDAVVYWLDHAYLDPGPELSEDEALTDPEVQALAEAWSTMEPPDPARVSREQLELDRRIEMWRLARESRPMRRWGLAPADYEAGDLVTYMFLHAGWLHLLGNLFILYLAGAPLEDVWGRPLYLVFYLSSGVAAALLFALRYAGSETPLIGASGAIAGIMGAFLVRFWRVKIKFFYFIWIIVRVWAGTFSASAMAIMPIWFLNEALWAYISDHFYRATPDGTASGVAYLAHVGGFLFGVVFALVVKTLGLEEKHLKPRIHESIGLVENPGLEEAARARSLGNPAGAREILEAELRKDPTNRELGLALWDLAIQERTTAHAAPRLIRILFEELRAGEVDLGLQHWHELESWAADTPVPAKVGVLVAETMLAQDSRDEAAKVIRRFAGTAAKLPPPYVPRLIRAAVTIDPRLASQAARAALGSAELPDEMRESLTEIAAAYPAPEEETGATAGPPAEPAVPTTGPADEEQPAELPEPTDEPIGPALQVVSAVPLRLTPDTIVLRAARHEALAVPFGRLRAIGAAEIRISEERPYWVLDLVLPSTAESEEDLVVLRCESRYFDLPSLVAGESAAAPALVAVVGELLGGSGVALIPEELDPFAPQPFASFRSLGDYERALRRRLATEV